MASMIDEKWAKGLKRPNAVPEINSVRARLKDRPPAVATAAVLRDIVLCDGVMAGAGLPVPTADGLIDSDHLLALAPAGIHDLCEVPRLLDSYEVFYKGCTWQSGQDSFAARESSGDGAALVCEIINPAKFAEFTSTRPMGRGVRWGGSSRLMVQGERLGDRRSVGKVSNAVRERSSR